MSAVAYAEARRVVYEQEPFLVKDKSYQQFPIGRAAADFLDAKTVERRIARNTRESYEGVLARLATAFPWFTSLEPFAEKTGPGLLTRFVADNWGGADDDTVRQRMAVLSSFFEWAYRTDRVSADPMRKVMRPPKRGGGAKRARVPQPHVGQLVSAQTTLRDQAAVLLLARLALRREDLRALQLRDIDLGRDELRLLHGKGGRKDTMPLAYTDLRQALMLHLSERDGHQDEFLLYPRRERTHPLSPAGIDLWFRRAVARADLPRYTMHQLRHAALDEMNRRFGPERARQLARHENVSTTQAYLHSEIDDLRAAFLELDEEARAGV